MTKKVSLLSLFIVLIFASFEIHCVDKDNKIRSLYKKPNLTVVFIIDQFAYHYIEKVKPFLNYGLARLLTKGTMFHDATFPHAMPTTPTGHATLSTGALPCVHGIVGYGYNDSKNKYTLVTDAPAESSAVFSPSGVYDYGVGPWQLKADTICDQYKLSGVKGAPCKAVSISYKPRSAVMLAGFAGEAFWVDEKTGMLTSSQAYFKNRLSDWVKKFNARKCLLNKKSYKWRPAYSLYSKAYASGVFNYKYTAVGQKQIGRKIDIDKTSKEPMKELSLFPQVDAFLIDAARDCVREYFYAPGNKKSNLLLFVSLSGFDLSSHILGPDSPEQLDKIYHLDRAIGSFIGYAQLMAGARNCLFAVTADHGSMPIPEVLVARGVKCASRVDANEITKKIDDFAKSNYRLEKLVKVFESPQFFFDKDQLAKLSAKDQAQLIRSVQAIVLSTPGIKNCWTAAELLAAQEYGTTNDYYKNLFVNQSYQDRIGDLVCQTLPYNQLTKYPTGTSHCTPYKYDVHVPLAFYRSGFIDKGMSINRPVCMTSFAPTLAKLLCCQAPSGCNAPVLGELFKCKT